MKAYIIFGNNGCYDDYYPEIIAVTLSKRKANKILADYEQDFMESCIESCPINKLLKSHPEKTVISSNKEITDQERFWELELLKRANGKAFPIILSELKALDNNKTIEFRRYKPL